MKKNLVFCLFLAVLAGCSKGKFQTKPQLIVKSTNTDIVPKNGTLRVTLEFTDKEGDVSDSLLIVRQRLNRKGKVDGLLSPYKLPSFPNTSKGEIQVDLEYQFGLVFNLNPIAIPGSVPQKFEPDTLNLKFVARDKAGNKSDTATVTVVVIR